jgi:hypothetical protein
MLGDRLLLCCAREYGRRQNCRPAYFPTINKRNHLHLRLLISTSYSGLMGPF